MNPFATSEFNLQLHKQNGMAASTSQVMHVDAFNGHGESGHHRFVSIYLGGEENTFNSWSTHGGIIGLFIPKPFEATMVEFANSTE